MNRTVAELSAFSMKLTPVWTFSDRPLANQSVYYASWKGCRPIQLRRYTLDRERLQVRPDSVCIALQKSFTYVLTYSDSAQIKLYIHVYTYHYYVAPKATYIRLLNGKIGFFGFFSALVP